MALLFDTICVRLSNRSYSIYFAINSGSNYVKLFVCTGGSSRNVSCHNQRLISSRV